MSTGKKDSREGIGECEEEGEEGNYNGLDKPGSRKEETYESAFKDEELAADLVESQYLSSECSTEEEEELLFFEREEAGFEVEVSHVNSDEEEEQDIRRSSSAPSGGGTREKEEEISEPDQTPVKRDIDKDISTDQGEIVLPSPPLVLLRSRSATEMSSDLEEDEDYSSIDSR